MPTVRDPWERARSPHQISEIDQALFADYLEHARRSGKNPLRKLHTTDPATILPQLGLADGVYLTNAAMVLFTHSHTQALQMATYADDPGDPYLDICQYHGAIWELIQKAMAYVQAHIASCGGRRQARAFEPALQEAVCNAFAHREMLSEKPVEIRIFPGSPATGDFNSKPARSGQGDHGQGDRDKQGERIEKMGSTGIMGKIEICSPGSFPGGLSPALYLGAPHMALRRNPLITSALRYFADTDGYATGLQRIQIACQKAGCQVHYVPEEACFTVRFLYAAVQ